MANAVLNRFNVRIDSCTAERAQAQRRSELEKRGHFEQPIVPILPQFHSSNPEPIFAQIRRDAERFTAICSNKNGFSLTNDYFTTPDAEVLYAMVQFFRPAKVIEIGSGNSTHLFRLAAGDAGITTHITSIDPHPRRDVSGYSDLLITKRVEDWREVESFHQLRENDILFVDSSHQVMPGNDVNWLVLTILPMLAAGVLVHFHDIFLPYEYPQTVEPGWHWTEQYLVQAFLTGNDSYIVLWAGHYLQRSRAAFEKEFPLWRKSTARSLWLQKSGGDR